jgi:tetratricopeptide (TPR) repeat protein
VPFEPVEAIEKTKAAAARAVEIDDSLAEAHAALALAYAIAWNWPGVEKELTRTIEINPGNARAYHHYSLFLNYMKRPDEAIAKIKQARDLDPLSLAINSDVGLAYYYARRYDEAIAAYRKALELDPNFAMAHRDLAQAYWQKGMYNEALAELETAINLSERNPDYVTLLGLVHTSADRKSEAQKMLHEIDLMAEQRYVPPSLKAVLYAALGRKDEAFVLLERAYESRSTHLVNLPVDPTFDPLRSDPRFHDLLRRMALPN